MRRLARLLNRELHHLIPLLILVLSLAAIAGEPRALIQLRLQVFDEFLRLKPRHYEPVPVRIVDIDDDSLERYGQWPWPRALLARLLLRLDELGAATVGFDFLFIDPDRTTPSRLLKNLDELPPDDPIVTRFASMPDHDQVFADAIGRGHVVLGFALRSSAHPKLPQTKASFAIAGDDPQPWVPHFLGAASDLRVLEKAAAGTGFLDTLPEQDGVSRRVPLIASVGGQLYPAFALDMLRTVQNASTYVVKSTGASGLNAFGEHSGVSAIKVGHIIVPTGADGTVWVHYTPHEASRFVSASKVLDGTIDPALIKDSIVIVGTTASGLKQFRPTPLDPAAAGVETHAQLIEQILLADNVDRPDWAHGAEAVFMLAIGLVLLLLLPRVGARWTALVGVLAVAPAVVGSWYAYVGHNWLIDPVLPSLVGFLVYLSSSTLLFFRAENERRHVRHAFSRYLAPSVVEHLAEHPERLRLGGEMRELTVMFSDVRNFTSIGERLDAQGLTSFLNHYLTPMTDAILRHEGLIDKYMGDGIMAFWNAPLDDPAHAEHACQAALAMRAELVRLNDGWRAEAAGAGRPFREVRAGIGLNTGECVVGNLGSNQRFDYSVLGDDANLASRLEGQTKTYLVDIIVGERTAERVPDFAFLELDVIQVIGREQAVRIFFLFGDASVAGTAAFASLEAAHNAMIAAYRARRWDEALDRLDACRAQAPEILQGYYQLFDERIADLRVSPPPENWDGVFAALTK